MKIRFPPLKARTNFQLLFSAAVIFLLSACGGGSAGSTPTNPTPVVVLSSSSSSLSSSSSSVSLKMMDVYIGPDGGDFNIGFVSDSLPDWISRTSTGYKANAVDGCSNRRVELKSGKNSSIVIQTSRLQCDDADLILSSNWNLIDNAHLWWKEQSGLLFTSPESDWPRKRGTGQFKFEVKYGDCGGTDCTRLDGTRDRSEIGLTFERNPDTLSWRPDPNSEFWYSFSFYIPKPYLEQGNQWGTSETTSIHQIMNTFETNGLRAWYPMVMLAKQYDGPMVARTYPTASPYKVFELIDDKDFEGHWHDIMVRYKASTTSGILQIWVNGSLKVDYTDRTIMTTDTSIYTKFGVYRPAVTTNPIQNAFFDELRYGQNRDSVEPR